MLDFIKSDVSIKNLAHSTVDQLASYSLDQLKGILAKALTDDWNKTLAAKEVKKIFSDNELFVSSEKATSKLFWCEMSYLLAQYYFWNKPIKQLDKDGNEVVEGVKESLSSVCGGDTVATVKSLEQDTWVGANTETSNHKQVASKPFDYQADLLKLKQLPKKQFKELLAYEQRITNFSSYYVPKLESVDDELEDLQVSEELADNQLTPKLHLLSKLINYTFLMCCLNDLACHFNEDNSLITKIGDCLISTWFSVCFLCFNNYCTMPLINWQTYQTLLSIHLEATQLQLA